MSAKPAARFTICPVADADREQAEQIITERWGAPVVAVHDTLYRPAELPGFLAKAGAHILGLLTYRIETNACEIVSLDALQPRAGIGTALVEAAAGAARARLIKPSIPEVGDFGIPIHDELELERFL